MKWEGRALNQLIEKQVQSETGSLGYLEANMLCRGNTVLGVKGLKDAESLRTLYDESLFGCERVCTHANESICSHS